MVLCRRSGQPHRNRSVHIRQLRAPTTTRAPLLLRRPRCIDADPNIGRASNANIDCGW
jgi:hypothetical protein